MGDWKMSEKVTNRPMWYNANDVQAAKALSRELLDFYLLRCPYAKSDQSAASSALSLNLSDNGWKKEKLHQLMQWVGSHFVDERGSLLLSFKVSDSVNDTIQDYGLDVDNPATAPNRCVLQIKNKINVFESGECTVRLSEAYATCLFRHIRNSLAHGNYRITNQGHVLLLDTSSKMNTANASKKYTCGLLCEVSFLETLKQLVENRPEDMTLSEAQKSQVGKGYRVKLDKQVVLEPKSDDQETQTD